MVQTPVKPISLNEFLKLPETKPASEYINGKIIQKPMPQGKHSSIQTELAALLNFNLRQQKIARAFSELRCTFGDRSIVPDIAVFEWSHILRDDNGEIANSFDSAPDWVIEILSPGQSQTKVTKNILHCLECGSTMGWLIDPEEKAILVYLPKQQTLIFDNPAQVLPLPSFTQELSLTVDDIFALLLN
jgi:Uma2 family endonuclease